MRSPRLLFALSAALLLAMPTVAVAGADQAADEVRVDKRQSKRLVRMAERAKRADPRSDAALAAWQDARAVSDQQTQARCSLEIGWIHKSRGELGPAREAFESAALGHGGATDLRDQALAELQVLEGLWLQRAVRLGEEGQVEEARAAFVQAEACAGDDIQRVMLERGYFEKGIDAAGALVFLHKAAEGPDAELAAQATGEIEHIGAAEQAPAPPALPSLAELLTAASAAEAELPAAAPDRSVEKSLLDAAERSKRRARSSDATLEAWRTARDASGAAGRQRASLELGWICKETGQLEDAEAWFLAAAVGPSSSKKVSAMGELAMLGQLWTTRGSRYAVDGDSAASAAAFDRALMLGADPQIIAIQRGYTLAETDLAAARAAFEEAARGPDDKLAQQAKDQLAVMPTP